MLNSNRFEIDLEIYKLGIIDHDSFIHTLFNEIIKDPKFIDLKNIGTLVLRTIPFSRTEVWNYEIVFHSRSDRRYAIRFELFKENSHEFGLILYQCLTKIVNHLDRIGEIKAFSR
jgi:hypothetical protein